MQDIAIHLLAPWYFNKNEMNEISKYRSKWHVNQYWVIPLQSHGPNLQKTFNCTSKLMDPQECP